jgi:branched-chain amino acid transport system ATP-binding protein
MCASSTLGSMRVVKKVTGMSNNIEEVDDGGANLMDDTILEVRDISIAFGGLQALTHVSLEVRVGEIYGLVGPNGAGKTVLLNCINGIYSPKKGGVFFKGREITRMHRYKVLSLGIARTFQHIELFHDMTVIENTLLGMHIHIKTGVVSGGLFWGWGRKEEESARRKAEEILDFLELYPYRKQKVGNLSFGVQKIVGLSRALASDPELILMDEIFSGLNREEKEDLARFVLRIVIQKKISIVWVEHDMKLITDLADRMACLSYGEIVARGLPQEVISNPFVVEAYLGDSKNPWMKQISSR